MHIVNILLIKKRTNFEVYIIIFVCFIYLILYTILESVFKELTITYDYLKLYNLNTR